jgi:urease accessory protein
VTTSAFDYASLTVRAGIGGEPIVSDVEEGHSLTFEPAPWGIWLVGSPDRPVGGQELQLRVSVGVGCCLEVRSQAPTVARPGPAVPGGSSSGPASFTHTTVGVANDAMVTWCPQPGIASPGCHHINETVFQLTSNARLAWRDEVVLERWGDDYPGTWRSGVRIIRDGWPVVASELALGPGSGLWRSPAVLEGARALSMYVVVDPGHEADAWCSSRESISGATGVALPLAGPGVQILAWGDDLGECRGVADRLLDEGGVPLWAQARWRGAQVPLS